MDQVETNAQPARPYHHGDLRNALIQAGLEILAEGGTQALGFREVARRAGVSSAAPYRHFSGKAALIAAIAEAGFSALMALKYESRARFPDDPVAQFRAEAVDYVTFALANPQQIRVMFGGILSHPDCPESVVKLSLNLFSMAVETVRTAQAKNLFYADDPEQQAMTMWTAVHGLVMIILDQNGSPVAGMPTDPAEMTDWILAPLMRGLLTVHRAGEGG